MRPTTSRHVLDEDRTHPAIRAKIDHLRHPVVREVEAAVAAHPVVVVGMAMNPFPRKARKLLDGLGIAHHDLDYGSYLSQWRTRLALKMWSGWPTLPMIFVQGVLVGGADDVRALADSGELAALLAAGQPAA